MDPTRESHYEYLLEIENQFVNIFLSELKLFQNKLNSYINNIKSQIIKEMKLRQEFLNKIFNKIFTYIDIQNLKTLLNNESFKIINDNISKFCTSKTFIEKYDFMRNIFNEGILKGKYIENLNPLNIIKKFGMNIIPLNKNHFIQISKNLEKNKTKLEIIKDNSDRYLNELKYDILSEKSFNFIFKVVSLKKNIDIEK